MRHGKAISKLNRVSSHRNALMKNLALNLLKNERIKTTKQKAKALRSFVEKMITRAKENTVHNKREIAKKIKDRKIITKLFDDIAPRYKERNGGYTRIYKLGFRAGDAADQVIIELVEEDLAKKQKKSKAKSKASVDTKKETKVTEPEKDLNKEDKKTEVEAEKTEEPKEEVQAKKEDTVEEKDSADETKGKD